MKIIFHIASRYAFTKSRQNIINIINAISSLILMTGSASLFVVLSAFGGLRQISLNFVNASNPDLKIEAQQGKFFTIDTIQFKNLEHLDGVISYSKTLEEKAFLSFRKKNFIAYIKGIDDKYSKVTPISEYVPIGRWAIKNYRAVIGSGISRTLGVGLFDEKDFLKVIIPKSGMKSITSLTGQIPYRQLYLTVSGIYSLNDEFDKKYIYASFDKVQRLLNTKTDELSSLELKLSPHADEAMIKNQLRDILGDHIKISNRFQQNASVYKMLKTEEAAIYLIFMLVLVVALFNLSGAIIMMILEKKKNIWTLLSLGLTFSQVRRIFFLQGFMVTAVSAILGLAFGYGLCLLQLKFEVVKIGYQQPYPIKISGVDALVVFVIILCLGLLVSWLASRRVSKRLFVN